MNRIDELFTRKQESVLSIYFTAGYPELNDTTHLISGLEKAGADLIEIGFPFSDPVADGPVIQASSHQALENGMNLDILFEQLLSIKATSSIPKIMMGYFNTVYQYGVDRFISKCATSGVDGVIIPDLPPEVYEKEYRQSFEAAGIHTIFLVAPQTTPERAEYLQALTKGFLYQLSMSGTTGNPVVGEAQMVVGEDPSVIPQTNGMPVMIGFGIHDHATFEMACRHANGAIIGTAFIRHLATLEEDGRQETRDRRHKTKDIRQETGDRGREIGEICKSFIDNIKGSK